MTTPIIGRCWDCGADLSAADIGRETLCLGCGKATRVCRNCRWYDPTRAQQCQEPLAEAVMNKERATYCEFFEPTREPSGAGADPKADALKAAEELFK